MFQSFARLVRISSRLAPLALFMATAAGCGAAVYQPSKGAAFELDPATEIDDDDVRKAFEARPQMPESVQIAYYAFDGARADAFDAALKTLPGVRGTYRIPALLLTGQRTFTAPRPWEPAAPISIKKLRLLAARAHCDLLVVFDNGHRVDTSANGLAAFDVLLLPALFMPFLDLDVKSAADAFVIDVRNGYLYGHVSAQQAGTDDYVTIYSSDGADLIAAQWPKLLAETTQGIQQVLESERARAPKP